jgi:signal-transduction protein with cAMP-binding, CBS, and nucleotidyltransferase domain
MQSAWVDRVYFPQHRQTIERLGERFRNETDVLATLVLGSVARGEARAKSDVDCDLVLTDGAHQPHFESGHLLVAGSKLGDDLPAQAVASVIDRR